MALLLAGAVTCVREVATAEKMAIPSAPPVMRAWAPRRAARRRADESATFCSSRRALNTIPASIARPMTDKEQRQHHRPSTRIA
jgi:hypothetical protein